MFRKGILEFGYVSRIKEVVREFHDFEIYRTISDLPKMEQANEFIGFIRLTLIVKRKSDKLLRLNYLGLYGTGRTQRRSTPPFGGCDPGFEAWREADREFRHSYRGALRWKTINGTQYLYRTFGKIGNSLGPRSPELEKVKADYTEQRTKLRRTALAL